MREDISVLNPIHSIPNLAFFPPLSVARLKDVLTLLPPCLSHHVQNLYFVISYNISSSPFHSLLFRRKLSNQKNCYNFTTTKIRNHELWTGILLAQYTMFSLQQNNELLRVDLVATSVLKTSGLAVNGDSVMTYRVRRKRGA
jgi:hypothetical protein